MTQPQRPRIVRRPGPWEPPAPPNGAMEGQQFHRVYRGMHVAVGYGEHPPRVSPHDDAELLKRINPAPYAGGFYGTHWTSHPETSRQFATGTQSNKDHGDLRVGPDHHVVGVVLEAHTTEAPEASFAYKHYGEHEVRTPRPQHVERLLAHVHEMRKVDDLAHHNLRDHTYVRTFEVPPEHWRKP